MHSIQWLFKKFSDCEHYLYLKSCNGGIKIVVVFCYTVKIIIVFKEGTRQKIFKNSFHGQRICVIFCYKPAKEKLQFFKSVFRRWGIKPINSVLMVETFYKWSRIVGSKLSRCGCSFTSDWRPNALMRLDRHVTVRWMAEDTEMFHNSRWESVHTVCRRNIQSTPHVWRKIERTEYRHTAFATRWSGRELHEINYYGWWDVGLAALRCSDKAVIFIMEVMINRKTTKHASGQIECQEHAVFCDRQVLALNEFVLVVKHWTTYTVQSNPAWCKHRVAIYRIYHSIF
jgi:hypothetical protein